MRDGGGERACSRACLRVCICECTRVRTALYRCYTGYAVQSHCTGVARRRTNVKFYCTGGTCYLVGGPLVYVVEKEHWLTVGERVADLGFGELASCPVCQFGEMVRW